MWLQVQILPRRPKEKMNNEEYIHSQARGMDLCRTYVDLGTAIDKDKIIDLHHLSDEHLRILSRSVAKENEKRHLTSAMHMV